MIKNNNVLDPDRYPGNKPVMTPKGEFKSVTQAAKAYDRSRTVIYRRCKRQDEGWYYLPHEAK